MGLDIPNTKKQLSEISHLRSAAIRFTSSDSDSDSPPRTADSLPSPTTNLQDTETIPWFPERAAICSGPGAIGDIYDTAKRTDKLLRSGLKKNEDVFRGPG